MGGAETSHYSVSAQLSVSYIFLFKGGRWVLCPFRGAREPSPDAEARRLRVGHLGEHGGQKDASDSKRHEDHPVGASRRQRLHDDRVLLGRDQDLGVGRQRGRSGVDGIEARRDRPRRESAGRG